MRTIIAIFLFAASVTLTGNLFAADVDGYTMVKEQHITNIVDATTFEKPDLRKTAIIVENRAGEQFNDKVSVLEDLISSRVAGKGYSVISRDVAVNALKSYSSAGITVSSQQAAVGKSGASTDRTSASMEAGQSQVDQNTAAASAVDTGDGNPSAAISGATTHQDTTAAELHAKLESEGQENSAHAQLAQSTSAQIAMTADTTALDDALNDNSSALRLAQTLGADFILIPSITSYGTEKKAYSGNGIETVNVIHTLRVSYKIVEAGMGGAISGGTVAATKTFRQTDNLQTDDSDLINELLDDAADQLADKIASDSKTIQTTVAKDNMVGFKISCTMTDPRLQPILVSAIGISPDNHVVLNKQPLPVEAIDVTVELDGAAIGSAPGDFKARPGFHKLRLSREGFDDWVRTINVYDGQTLHVALQMSEDGYARWADTTSFLADLDANRKLTDAEVNKINGIAEYFKNSHFRVDATNLPNTSIYRGIY